MAKERWSFDTKDWTTDVRVTALSPSARGVWFDWLCVMKNSGGTGVLEGDYEQLARWGRCTTGEVSTTIAELKTTGAADVDDRTARPRITNRRMKREHAKKNGTAKPKPIEITHDAEGAMVPPGVRLPANLNTKEFGDAWLLWIEHRRSRTPVSARAAGMQLTKLSMFGPEQGVAAIKRSIENDWQGLFPEREKGSKNGRTLIGPGQLYDPNHKPEF